jgi:nucleoside phosphorylase
MVWKAAERVTTTRKIDTATREECAAVTHKIEGKSLVVMQVNCRSIYNKSLNFWNLIDTYDPDAVIGTESWLRE